MRIQQAVFIDDLIRGNWQAKQFFYDLVRSVVNFGSGLPFIPSPRLDRQGPDRFDFDLFRSILGDPSEYDWSSFYFDIPAEAKNLIRAWIPENTLIFSYEMAPWLETLLREENVPFVDIRLSSLRFCPDLFIGLRSNLEPLDEEFRLCSIPDDMFRYEADMLSARLRHSNGFRIVERDYTDSAVFIGQTAEDTSLVQDSGGGFLKLNTFLEDLLRIRENYKNVYYKPHPMASKRHIRDEIQTLKKIFKTCLRIDENLYSVMCSREDFLLFGISSGALSEGVFFNKEVNFLYKPIFQYYSNPSDSPRTGYYSHWNSHQFLSPGQWNRCLGELVSIEEEPKLGSFWRPPVRNELRRLHNAYWGFAEVDLLDSEYFRTLGRFYGRRFKFKTNRPSGILRIIEEKTRRWMSR